MKKQIRSEVMESRDSTGQIVEAKCQRFRRNENENTGKDDL